MRGRSRKGGRERWEGRREGGRERGVWAGRRGGGEGGEGVWGSEVQVKYQGYR